MQTLGTVYGGWDIPNDIILNENSIIYSVGVGEDISFDLKLVDKYNCKIRLIDPTKRAINHFDEIKTFYKNGDSNFSGDIQSDYLSCIKYLKPNIDNFTYINQGLYNKTAKLKFYKQTNEKYVSQSIETNMFGKDYDLINVTTISDIMQKYNDTKIDILKLDIEGSEIKVLNNMIDNEIFPNILCIEFDLYINKKDPTNETKKIIVRLLNHNYKIICNKNYNITFIQKTIKQLV
jgi:FkbM family methyltransferase